MYLISVLNLQLMITQVEFVVLRSGGHDECFILYFQTAATEIVYFHTTATKKFLKVNRDRRNRSKVSRERRDQRKIISNRKKNTEQIPR